MPKHFSAKWYIVTIIFSIFMPLWRIVDRIGKE